MRELYKVKIDIFSVRSSTRPQSLSLAVTGKLVANCGFATILTTCRPSTYDHTALPCERRSKITQSTLFHALYHVFYHLVIRARHAAEKSSGVNTTTQSPG